MSPAVEVGVLTTGPPGNSPKMVTINKSNTRVDEGVDRRIVYDGIIFLNNNLVVCFRET